MNFSIILLSRNRVHFLKNLLKSIEDTCLGSYEVLVGCDLDDNATRDGIRVNDYKNLKMFFSTRSGNLSSYLNYLANETRGDYIFGLNDDTLLTNRGWDISAKEKLDKFGKICYGCTHDNSIDKVGPRDYASFPIISKNAYKTLGFFIEEKFGNHGADVITYRIYEQAGCICDLPEIEISHLYHDTQQHLSDRLTDPTAKEMIQRSLGDGLNVNDLFTYDVSTYVEKLKAVA